jgi:hypothetical protein
MTKAQHIASVAPTLSRKNLLINGDFAIWQRGSGPYSGAGYCADRWKILTVVNADIRYVAGLYGSSASMAAIFHGSATSALAIQQSLELAQARRLQGRRVTFSIKAKTTTGTATLNLIARISSTPNSSTATFTNLTPLGPGSFIVDTTLRTFSVTVDIPGNATAEGVGFYIGVVDGPNGGWTYLLDAQAEVGSEATDFDTRLVGEQLQDCLRYFYPARAPGAGVCFSATAATLTVSFPVAMRVQPVWVATTIVGVVQNATGGSLTVVSYTALSATSYGAKFNLSVAGGLVAGDSTVHSGYLLNFDAEL